MELDGTNSGFGSRSLSLGVYTGSGVLGGLATLLRLSEFGSLVSA